MSREAIGTVVSVAARGVLVVRASPGVRVKTAATSGALRVGAPVVDGQRGSVGRLMDVIGPVKAPHLLVQPPRGAKLHRLQGKELYLP